MTFHVFQEERFRRDYGPNYHPTFQVILEAGTEDVELRLLKRGDEEVWIRQVPLTGKLLFKPIQSLYCHTRIYNVDHLHVNVEGIFHHKYMFGKCISYFSLPPPPDTVLIGGLEVRAVEQLRFVRCKFVEKVSEPTIKCLLDGLLQKKVVNNYEKDSVKVIAEKADKARAIIDMVLNKGTFACLTMKTLLCELDQCLSSELGLN